MQAAFIEFQARKRKLEQQRTPPNALMEQILSERGPQCLADKDAFKQLVAHLPFEAFTELKVAQCLAFMARHSSSQQQQQQPSATSSSHPWNVASLVTCVSQMNPRVNWGNVIRQLDCQDFFILDAAGIQLILDAHSTAIGGRFPIEMFYSRWRNIKGQISFIKHAVGHPALAQVMRENKILTVESLANVVPSTKAVAVTWVSQPWNSADLIATLIQLADVESDDGAKHLLDLASRQSTELVLLGLVMVKPPWTALHLDVVKKLISIFLVGHSSSVFVLSRVWASNRDLIVDCMSNLYSQDSNLLSRLLDVAQDLKGLSTMLECENFPFAIDLATLASRREYLNLEKWLQDTVRKAGVNFTRALLDFLQMKVMIMSREQTGLSAPVTITLSEKSLSVIIVVLREKESQMSPNDSYKFRETCSLMAQISTGVAAVAGQENDGAAVGEPSFAADVEDEANLYYEKIYAEQIAIPVVIELLSKFQSSSTPREVDVYSCMVHNLFDEYRFFSKYPDKELVVTGELFGALIQNGLVSPLRLTLGLRYVLESLRQPLGSKMFRFGVTALTQFQSRLTEWPPYCEHLSKIAHLTEASPEISQTVQQIVGITGAFVMRGSAALDGMKAVDAELALSSPAETDVMTPSEEVLEKILFIVNNISTNNLAEKIAELMPLLKLEYYPWFSQYFIQNRVSVEPNFHPLYSQFMKVMASKPMHDIMLKTTVASCSSLLSSDKTLTSSQERTLLKNLGSWLGSQTLAQNIPILHRALPLKNILVLSSSSEPNRLIVTIPFICKILEQTKDSKVFRPPNPWLMGILGVLVELYQYGELKLNLKFEIEVMCKNAEIDLKNIEPSEVVRPRSQLHDQTDGMYNRAMQASTAVKDANGQSSGNDVADLSAGPTVISDESGNFSLPDLAKFVSFASNIELFNMHSGLKKMVLLAIDRAVREIIGPVVERSISIASVATRELVLKDFAQEPNEDVMRRAANLMVQNLSGNLAMVTSKEPFRISMTSHLRSLFLQNGVGEPMLDSLVGSTVLDNIDLGCAIVEKAAMQKSVCEINETLAQAYTARRRQRERGQPWVEVPQYSNSKFPAILPDALKLVPGNRDQSDVYEAFWRSGSVQPSVSDDFGPQFNSLTVDTGDARGANKQPLTPLQEVTEHVSTALQELDKLITASSCDTLNNLSPTDAIVSAIQQVQVGISRVYTRDELMLEFTQEIVYLLFSHKDKPNGLALEIYILLLERFCELSKRVAKEFTIWVLYSDDERKFTVGIMNALVNAGLVNILELDIFLVKRLQTGVNTSIKFVLDLAVELICESGEVTATEFHLTLEYVRSMDLVGTLTQFSATIAKLRDAAPGAFMELDQEYLLQKEKCLILFEDWLQVHQMSNSWEEPLVAQILASARALRLDDADELMCFLRHCLEASVESYHKLKNAPSGDVLSFQIIDALGSIVVFLLSKLYSSNMEGFEKVLITITLVQVHSHETRRELFDQKPFFRLFSSLMIELEQRVQDSHPEFFAAAMIAFSNTFHTLRPSFAPGFIFAWLDLISHRSFLPHLMSLPDKRGWPMFHVLLVDLFQFMSTFLNLGELNDSIRTLYKGTLRVLLLLLHDYPEFLCDYHFSFCDVIPATCIQLRNLILSAFPRSMRLPDPFTPNLKVDLLPEINQVPYVASDYRSILSQDGNTHIAEDVDAYLRTRAPDTLIKKLRHIILLPEEEMTAMGTVYDISKINAIVMLVGVTAVKQMQSKTPQATMSVTQSAPMDIFDGLVKDIDSEGRYHVLNAIANQLRYPNSHTHYFSCVLLYLFAEAKGEMIQEQVTRVLLERLIVNRPHPWGLLITFIELLKNPRYNFWSHKFTKCAPDIEKLFESVARSCMLPAGGDNNPVA